MNIIEERVEARSGPSEAVRALAAARFPLAVASSSGSCVIGLVLEKIGLGEYFQMVQSAEFEPHGKPLPGVYLTTAERLRVQPETCVAIEDSVNGLLAAKGAGMACIAVPAPAARHDYRHAVADMVLSSLTELDLDRLERL